MNADRLKRLRTMLAQVGSAGNFKGLKESFEVGTTGSAGPTLEAYHTNVGRLEIEFAQESLDVLRMGKTIDDDQLFALEAIVMPYYRPVVDIVQDRIKIEQLTQKWQHFASAGLRSRIEKCLLSIGRIDVPGLPSLPYAGTGFIVGAGLLMTNRHVAQVFSQGIGMRHLRLQPGLSALIDFYHENGRTESEELTVEGVVMIHPYWDMALLRVSGLSAKRAPLALNMADPATMTNREVVVVGYPGYDPMGDDEYQRIQNRIFRGTYYVKRLQPGLLRVRQPVESYTRQVQAVTHDSTTLGGNSGSAVLVLPQLADEPLQVVGLHFAGKYLVANYAVPSADLALDSRIVDAGVNFVGRPEPRGDFYGPCWREADVCEAPCTTSSQRPVFDMPYASSAMVPQWHQKPDTDSRSVPIEVSVAVGQRVPRAGPPPAVPNEPTLEEGLFSRQVPVATSQLPYAFSLASLALEGFEWPTAQSLALASRLVYEDQAAIKATACNLWGMEGCQLLEVDDTLCLVAHLPKTVLIAFRGTATIGNWLTDLDVASSTRPYGLVHRGFFSAYRALEPMLLAALDMLPGRSLVLTGHSLGGALAAVAAAEWSEQFRVALGITFGQPAVGKGNFQRFMQSYASNFIRLVNNDDIVARVPPTYAHVGRLIQFDAAGNVVAKRETPVAEAPAGAFDEFHGGSMLSEADFDRMRAILLQERLRSRAMGLESLEASRIESLIPSLSDHRIDSYLSKITLQTGHQTRL